MGPWKFSWKDSWLFFFIDVFMECHVRFIDVFAQVLSSTRRELHQG